MLGCIACSKRLDEDGCGTSRPPASRDRDAVKNLAAQIKDVALKLSGSYRYSKPSTAGQSELADVLRNSNSSSTGTPKFHNAFEQLEEEEEGKEWISHVEPGVIITLVSLKGGGNELKRIRFSQEMFNKTQAQLWWTENHEKVSELYNIPPNARRESSDLLRSDEEERDANIQESGGEETPVPPQPQNILPRAVDASNPSCGDADRSEDLQKSSDNQSIKSATNSSDQEQEQEREEQEWVEEDEPGVYITIRSSPTGAREIKRLKFRREKFSEMQARLWWEDNRCRIQEQYLDGHGM